MTQTANLPPPVYEPGGEIERAIYALITNDPTRVQQPSVVEEHLGALRGVEALITPRILRSGQAKPNPATAEAIAHCVKVLAAVAPWFDIHVDTGMGGGEVLCYRFLGGFDPERHISGQFTVVGTRRPVAGRIEVECSRNLWGEVLQVWLYQECPTMDLPIDFVLAGGHQ